MARPIRALVDLAALANNLEMVRHCAPRAKIMAVIKADAYGHGALGIASHLEKVDALAVASIEEALSIRPFTRKTIVLLEGFFSKEELPLISSQNFEIVLHSFEQLHLLINSSVDRIAVWAKVDTGMHRLGFAPFELQEVIQKLNSMKDRVNIVGLMTHFGCADEIDNAATYEQLRCFDAVKQNDEPTSMANSAAILGWPKSRTGWLRPGIMLYGASPFAERTGDELGLVPVMTLVSEIICIRQCKEGDAVGYGGEWVCKHDMRIGVVAAGYADGYPRHAKPGTPVLIKGRYASLVGRVCMDMILVDVSKIDDVSVGDEVILWGKDLPVELVARHASTIPNDLLSGVTKRVPRIMINHNKFAKICNKKNSDFQETSWSS